MQMKGMAGIDFQYRIGRAAAVHSRARKRSGAECINPSLFERSGGVVCEGALRIELQRLLDSVASLRLVALLLKRHCQPNPGLILPGVECQRFLETFYCSVHVASEHFRREEILPAEAGPHTWVFIIQSQRTLVFFGDHWAVAGSSEHAAKRNFPAVEISEQAVRIGRVFL